MEVEQNERTAEAIQKVEKNFALDLPLVVVDGQGREDSLGDLSHRIQSYRKHILPIPTPPKSSHHPIQLVISQRQSVNS